MSESTTIEKTMLTAAELSQRWALNLDSVYRFTKAGQIPSVRLGGRRGRILFPITAIEKMEQQEQPA